MSGLHRREIALLLVFCLSSTSLSLDLGDICHHKKKDLVGKCKLLENCPTAIADLRNKIYPQNCGFIQSSVIVCCVETVEKSTTTTSTTTTTTTTTLRPVTTNTERDLTPATTATTTTSSIRKLNDRVPGEISRRKCKEYENLAYEEELSPLLISQSEIEKNEICPWDFTPAVSGGVQTKLGEFPHMAFLKYKDKSRCGGTLISERFVITAGHCVDTDSNVVPIAVRLGDLNITDPNDDIYVKEITVKKVHVHPDFKAPVQYNDLALIELDRPVPLNVYLKPACLYTDEIINFDSAIVTGWGKTEEHVVSDHLLKAYLNIFSENSCNQRYTKLPYVFPKGINYNIELCAGSFTSNKDTCGGDSGGPLQIYSTDVYCSHYLVGITSFGLKCGEANYPAVYTKVYPYLKWIEDIVWPE